MEKELTLIQGFHVKASFAKYIILDQEPTIEQLLDATKEFYQMPNNECGGSLHVVLDDGNLDRKTLLFAIDYALARADYEAVFLAKMLLKVDILKRKLLYQLFQEIDR